MVTAKMIRLHASISGACSLVCLQADWDGDDLKQALTREPGSDALESLRGFRQVRERTAEELWAAGRSRAPGASAASGSGEPSAPAEPHILPPGMAMDVWSLLDHPPGGAGGASSSSAGRNPPYAPTVTRTKPPSGASG